ATPFDKSTRHAYWAPAVSELGQMLVTSGVETDHPYLKKTYTFNSSVPGALGFRVHFTQFTLGGTDKVVFYDVNNIVLQTMTGNLGLDVWSPVMAGAAARVELIGTVTGSYGFAIDKVQYTTTPTTKMVHSYDG